MKTAISHPDKVFEAAETLAGRLGNSRSELYSNALKAYLQKFNRDHILQQLNQVFAEEDASLDPSLATLQSMSLPHEDW